MTHIQLTADVIIILIGAYICLMLFKFRILLVSRMCILYMHSIISICDSISIFPSTIIIYDYNYYKTTFFPRINSFDFAAVDSVALYIVYIINLRIRVLIYLKARKK